ncbi:MAG: alpha/beta fold hydrolase [Candidatus Binatia bacterium]
MPREAARIFRAGDVALDSRETLPEAFLAYQTFGTLNRAGDNAIVMPTHFGGTHLNSLYLLGEGRALDPTKYFITIVNLIGNGQSVSPSNTQGSAFPRVTIADNVRLQHRLLTEALGVRRLALAVGFSMGAIQVYHLAALYPAFVARLAPICGAARISRHNDVFVRGMRRILMADPAWNGGQYTAEPVLGLRTMARAWAAWPPSAHFYRHQLYHRLGYDTLDDFLERYWEATFLAMDANDVLCQIATWRSADISDNPTYDGDFVRALRAIEARSFVMPCVNDAYFPPEDSRFEVSHMRHAELRPIDSQWGHWAGSGRNPEDTAFIDRQLLELLAR